MWAIGLDSQTGSPRLNGPWTGEPWDADMEATGLREEDVPITPIPREYSVPGEDFDARSAR